MPGSTPTSTSVSFEFSITVQFTNHPPNYQTWDYVGSGPWNTFYIVSVPDCSTAQFSGGVGGGYVDYEDGVYFAN